MAEESVDVPVKRPREEEENGVSTSAVGMETEGNPDYISSVIPGWFSEISPMWPGVLTCTIPSLLCAFSFVCCNV